MLAHTLLFNAPSVNVWLAGVASLNGGVARFLCSPFKPWQAFFVRVLCGTWVNRPGGDSGKSSNLILPFDTMAAKYSKKRGNSENNEVQQTRINKGQNASVNVWEKPVSDYESPALTAELWARI